MVSKFYSAISSSVVIMHDSIKFLQFAQTFHRIIGIFPSQSNQHFPSQSSNSWKQTIFFVSSVQFAFTTIGFLVFQAHSMFDYGFGFFVFSSIINGTVNYFLFVWQSENTLKFIANYEEFIKKSMKVNTITSIVPPNLFLSVNFVSFIIRPTGVHSQIEYGKLVEENESYIKFFCSVFCATGAFCLFTALPYTYVRYYVWDLGEKSFYLFYPAWFVSNVQF